MTTPKRNEAVAFCNAEEYAELLAGRPCWTNGMEQDGDTVKLYPESVIDALQGEVSRLREALKFAERHCPCGARPESPNTHPHMPGCLIGAAMESST